MKRTALRTRSAPIVPTHLAMDGQSDSLADSFEEDFDEELVDYDDEREAMNAVVQGTLHSVN
jgi:hypothetical protein